jgi:hypothetical protein
MAIANLNKREELVTNTIAKSFLKGPESASMEIPPYSPNFIKFSKTVFYEVNLTSQCSHLEVLLITKFGSERGYFK